MLDKTNFHCLCNEGNCTFYDLFNSHGKHDLTISRRRKRGVPVKIPDYLPKKSQTRKTTTTNKQQQNQKPTHNPVWRDVPAPEFIYTWKLHLYSF